jgi:hypothetical protein
MTDKELKKMSNGKDFYFGAEEMCERGIATHVKVDGNLISAERYLKTLKKARKKCRKGGTKINTLYEAQIYGVDLISKLNEYVDNQWAEINKKLSDIAYDYDSLLR